MKAICASVNFDVLMELFLPRQREHNWKIPVQNDPNCGKHVTGVKSKTFNPTSRLRIWMFQKPSAILTPAI